MLPYHLGTWQKFSYSKRCIICSPFAEIYKRKEKMRKLMFWFKSECTENTTILVSYGWCYLICYSDDCGVCRCVSSMGVGDLLLLWNHYVMGSVCFFLRILVCIVNFKWSVVQTGTEPLPAGSAWYDLRVPRTGWFFKILETYGVWFSPMFSWKQDWSLHECP